MSSAVSMGGKLGFGTMRLPQIRHDGQPSVNIQRVARMVDLFMERGFNYFDTAYTYCDGHSEAALRQTLVERYPRTAYVLADKLPTMSLKSADDMQRIFDEQLRKCGVEYFDRYIVHCATEAFCRKAEHLGCFDFALAKRDEGLTRAVGFSFHDTPELLDRMLTEHPETDFVQLQINYVDWEHTRIRAHECYATARRHGKPVTVMCTLKGGLLASVPPMVEYMFRAMRPEDDPVAWALRFAASLDGVDYVLSGMSSVEDVERNTKALQFFEKLGEREYAAIAEAADIIAGLTPVQCTACGYCVPSCPANIAIPEYLHLYNEYAQMFSTDRYFAEYAAIGRKRGRASDCIECGLCDSMCPQHLRVAEWIGRVADVFEKHNTAAMA